MIIGVALVVIGVSGFEGAHDVLAQGLLMMIGLSLIFVSIID